MSNAHLTSPRVVVHRAPAIAFYGVFLVAVALPIAMVIAAIAQLSLVVIAIALGIALYNTSCQVATLLLAQQAIQPRRESARSTVAPPSLAIIIPAWNEQAALPRTLAAVLSQAEPPDLIIVSDDGSTDATIAQLTVLYDLEFQGIIGKSRLYPHLQVLRKPHSGKADSLNQAILLAPVDVVLVLDADTQLLPGALAALRQAFRRDPSLTVVGGVLLPRCSPCWLGQWFEFIQRYEYARMHLWRLAWTQLHSSLIVSGACSAFRREILLAIGGFNPQSWVEDYEVMYRMQQYLRSRRQPCRVRVEPGLRVHTEAPETVMTFLRQRRRWSGGFIETMFRYRAMVGNRRYGVLGQLYLFHNTLTLPQQPLYLIAGIVASLILIGQGITVPGFVLWLVLCKGVTDVLLNAWGIKFYRHYFQRREVSLWGMIGDAIALPLFSLPLAQISHTWGWVSCWYRRLSW